MSVAARGLEVLEKASVMSITMSVMPSRIGKLCEGEAVVISGAGPAARTTAGQGCRASHLTRPSSYFAWRKACKAGLRSHKSRESPSN